MGFLFSCAFINILYINLTHVLCSYSSILCRSTHIGYITGTSIALVPSGNLAIAGFTDGTLRLFDLTGTFVRDKNDPRGNPTTKDSYEFDDDASSSEEEMEIPSKGKRGSNEEVCSRVHQRFGVVACQ